MAKNYNKQINAGRKAASSYFSKQDSTSKDMTPLEKMNNQISNYKTRLEASGIDASKATDKRNIIEKALNLPEDQNFLFDVFEIINRPQQAIFGAIKNAQEGKDILEGFGRGISGTEDYYFGDILRNMGVDDTELFKNPLSGEKVSLADMLGLAGDIFLDPMDVPLFALKPAQMASKTTKGIDTATDIAKAADTASDIAKAAKVADTATDAAKYVYKFDPLAAMTNKGSKSLLEMGVGKAVKGTKSAIKKGAGAIIDAADVKTVKKLAKDSGLIADGTKVTKDMLPGLVDDLGKLGIDVPLKSQALSEAGAQLNRAFNFKGSLPANTYETVNRSNNAIDTAAMYGKQLNKQVEGAITDYATKYGKNFDDVDNTVQLYLQSKYAPQDGMDYYVKNALRNKGKSAIAKSDIIKGTDEELKAVKSAVENFVEKTKNVTDDAIRVVPVRGGIRLEGNKKLLGAIYNDDSMMKKLSEIKLNKASKIDNDILEQIGKLDELYDTNKDFKDLVDNVKGVYGEYNEYLKGLTGNTVDFGQIVGREGYVRTALTDEGPEILRKMKEIGLDGSKYTDDTILQGSKQTFKGRTQSSITEQAERDMQKTIAAKKVKTQSELDNLYKMRDDYVGTRKAELKSELAKVKVKETSAAQNAEKNFAKLNVSQQKQADLVKKYNTQIDDLGTLINDDIMKKAPKVSNPKLVEGLAKNTDTYVSKVKSYDAIKAKLADPNLTAKQVSTYQKQLDKAYDSVMKAKANVVTQTAKIQGAVEESFIKEAGKLADKVADKAAKTQEKLTKAELRNVAALDKIEQAKKSYEDITIQLKKQQENLKLQLKDLDRLAKNPEELNKQLKYISNEIAEKERIISVIESIEGKKLYSNSFTQGFDSFINMSSNEAKAMKNYNEVLLNAGLKNDDVLKFYKTGENIKLGPNMTLVKEKELNKMADYLDSMQDLMPENSELIKTFKQELKNSKAVAMDKDLIEMMAISSGDITKNAETFLEIPNKINNLFKKTSTLSPGFQLRNVTGNVSNMWLSGVPMKDVAKSYDRAIKLSKSDYIIDLVTKNAKGTLNAAEAADYKIIKQFIESGAMGSGKNIRDLGELIEKAATDKESRNILKKAWNGVFEFSAKANEKVDNMSRLALLGYASENPKYVAKLGAKDAIGAMHEVLFDPQNMSKFEKKYVKKIIPFYTFAKQNLMFQAKNITKNTSRYNRLIKTFNKAYDAVGEGNYRQYQKENFEIPLFNAGKGLTTLKSNLPVGDLGEYIENPLQRLVASTSPLIKTPFEQVTGVDTFTGRDISDRSPLQAMLDTTGLSNLTTKQINKIDQLINNNELDASDLAIIAPSMFRTNDADKIANQKAYEELMAYQAYVKKLKDQGQYVPTIRDLKSFEKFEKQPITNYYKMSDTEKEKYAEYQQYKNMVNNLKESGTDVPAIKSLISDTNSYLKAIKNTRKKRRSR